MKVDTNTKGNTHWFMFKAADFQVNKQYKFNIMNFSRSLEKFYKQGMNIFTKVDDGPWRPNSCTNIDYVAKSDIVRFERYHPETGEVTYQSCYGKLSFTYEYSPSD